MLRGKSKVEPQEGDLGRFASQIWATNERQQKKGPALSGSTFGMCPEKNYIRRQKELVEQVFLVGLDYDGVDAHEHLHNWKYDQPIPGVLAILHSSPSCGTPDENGNPILKFRVWIPLLKPISPEQYESLAGWLYENIPGLDQSCKDPSRLFFTTRNPKDAISPPWMNLRDGNILDPLPLIKQWDEAQALKELERKKKFERKKELYSSSAEGDARAREKYAQKAFDDAIQTVASAPKGGRNDLLNKKSFLLGTFVGAGCLSEQEVYAELYRAALACGLSDKEAQKTIESGLKSGISSPRDMSEIRGFVPKVVLPSSQTKSVVQTPVVQLDRCETEDTQDTEETEEVSEPASTISRPQVIYQLPKPPMRGEDREKIPASFLRLRYKLTAHGNAERLLDHYGDHILFNERMGWFTWDGQRWQLSDQGMARLYWDMVDHVLAPEMMEMEGDFNVQREYSKWIISSKSKSGRNDAMEILSDEKSIEITPDDLDSEFDELNVANGIVSLESGTLEEHCPTRKHTRMCRVSSQMQAFTDQKKVSEHIESKCPTWMRFLRDTFANNEEMIRYVQRAVGYSVTGKTSEQALFILYGHGRNGKSTFVNTIMHILGDYAATIPISSLLSGDRSNIPNDLARLPGVRFVSSIEPNKDVYLNEGKVKALTGGDTIMARFLNKEWFEFKPQFKLWLATNHLPRITGNDLGIWRRIHTIPFTVTVAKEDVDGDLENKLKAEADGILAWICEGAYEWFLTAREMGSGLIIPDDVAKANDEYRESSDLVGKFIEERCMIFPGKMHDDDFSTSMSDLYDSFREWSIAEGQVSRSKKWLSERLKERGLEQSSQMVKDYSKGTADRYWHGICLLNRVPLDLRS